jgi:hypothetical protein
LVTLRSASHGFDSVEGSGVPVTTTTVYLTGRREVAYANTEACMYFAGSRGAVLPYGYYGPYVPSGWVPPGWVLPPPGYGR